MSRSCPKNYIWRRSYTRKSKSGKIIKVKGDCIRSVSKSGKKRSIINRHIIKKKTDSHRRASKISKSTKLRCPRGTIKRTAYFRKSYTRVNKSGKKVYITRKVVPASCIKQRGIHGIKAIGPMTKGDLTRFGYKGVDDLSISQRHEALDKAVKKYGYLPVIKKLNAIYLLNRNTNPKVSKIFKKDQEWVSKKYSKLSPAQKSRSMVRRSPAKKSRRY